VKPVVSVTYKSNVRGLTKEVDERLERIVGRAAQDGSVFVRTNSDPPVAAFATQGDEANGIVRASVYVLRRDFWATMFDKGTLGKRVVPLEQPGRRRMTWTSHHRTSRKEFIAHRHPLALARGGIEPQYFLIRGKRLSEEKLGEYLIDGL
jgi:hypothetical protein